MITGFEEYTAELNAYELGLVPNIVSRLKLKIGKHQAVKSSYIVKEFKKRGKKMSGARWRKIVNYIRVNNMVPFLISTSKGYYIATTEEEIRNYLESLKQRINAITAVYDAMEHQLKTIPRPDASRRLHYKT